MNKLLIRYPFWAVLDELVPVIYKNSPKKQVQKCEQRLDFEGVFTWFDPILSFDSTGSHAGKCEQDVNRKKECRHEGQF